MLLETTHLMTVMVWGVMLMTKLTPAHIHARARSSVGHFFEYLYPLLHPKRPIEMDWYIHAMSEAIMSLSRGETTGLIINAPPRSSKTNLGTIFNIGFILGKDPSAEIMLLTYGEELTTVLASKVYHLMRIPPTYVCFHTHAVLVLDLTVRPCVQVLVAKFTSHLCKEQ